LTSDLTSLRPTPSTIVMLKLTLHLFSILIMT
jgi:hypothetical protein